MAATAALSKQQSAAGSSSAADVVRHDDSRLTDARTPLAHTHPGLLTYTAKTGNYTAVDGDLVAMSASGGNRTVTLPAGAAGAVVAVKKTDTSANTVTVNRAGSDTIDGETSVVLRLAQETIHLVGTGSGWVVSYQWPQPIERGPFICTNYVTLNGRTTGRWCNGTIAIPDPGYPYMLRFESGVEMRQNSQGRGRSGIWAGGSGSVSNQHSGGTQIAITPFHDRIGAYEQLCHFTIQTTPLTGATTLYICGYRESGTGNHDFSNYQYQVHAYTVPAY